MERGSGDAGTNRRYWDEESDRYQRLHAAQLSTDQPGWGVWQIPERRVRALGDVRGKDVLELGCGAAQWSICLAKQGARPVGLDNSARQLRHARRLMRRDRVRFPLVQGSAEAQPFGDGAFDVVFCDHGALSFADPRRAIPEVARVLRPGGLLAFNMATPIIFLCWNQETEESDAELHLEYFGLGRWEGAGHVEYQLPYGEWIRLFRRSGFVVEDLIELRPGRAATTTYPDYVALGWARRWPAENIWKVRKAGG